MIKSDVQRPEDENLPPKDASRFDPVVTIMAEMRRSAKSIGIDATIFGLSLCLTMVAIIWGNDVLKSVIGGLAFAVGWPFVKHLNALAKRSEADKKLT